LPFKLSSRGDLLVLGDAHGFAVERVEVPALAINEGLIRIPHATGELIRCSGLSPGKSNGNVCGAPVVEGRGQAIEAKGQTPPSPLE
jgi:hypothetical protein